MAYSAYAVANAFVERAPLAGVNDLSPMKLQKLMYIAQAYHLKVLNQPLLDDHFARWTYGPVIPAIYHEFKAYGSAPIRQKASTLAMDGGGYRVTVPTIPEYDHSSISLIEVILRQYGHLSAASLVDLTHRTGSGWAAGPADGSSISHEQIRADQTINPPGYGG